MLELSAELRFDRRHHAVDVLRRNTAAVPESSCPMLNEARIAFDHHEVVYSCRQQEFRRRPLLLVSSSAEWNCEVMSAWVGDKFEWSSMTSPFSVPSERKDAFNEVMLSPNHRFCGTGR